MNDPTFKVVDKPPRGRFHWSALAAAITHLPKGKTLEVKKPSTCSPKQFRRAVRNVMGRVLCTRAKGYTTQTKGAFFYITRIDDEIAPRQEQIDDEPISV